MEETEPFALDMPESYIRVQTSYYKRCRQPTIQGDYVELWIPWSSETLRQDLPRKQVKRIRLFDGFCCVPGHLHYREVRRVLQREWGLVPAINSLSYQTYRYDAQGEPCQVRLTGRFYSVSQSWLRQRLDEGG